MNLYGQSQFYVFANPVVSSDNTSVIYDGYSRITDGAGEFTYTLANGIAYVVTSSMGSTSDSIADCLDSTLLPPFNDIISALNNATAVSNGIVGNDTITCASGIKFQVTLSDATFVICSSGSNDFTAYESDMDITVDYLNSPVTITPPSLNSDVALSCETVIKPISVSETALVILTGQVILPQKKKRENSELLRFIARNGMSSVIVFEPTF
ncbi:uncharacterized protein PHALS_10681 [Plasmopara halstedii]|uniref:Uncharacterized protein n=1 Tax=Plasmopara halstedii TaxID=4781 RepID=A0A0P1AHM2_PLAHL|nr:uncharacterized protein PHALS_10681 [Plasmopara halstedii]CEG40485.1 hypothetical protein PHALS_10681 [Plasmopara halstedii]|eukprot:XP_024576854.1 hypothetical protein PHALS_10681 [Plasmopara halstedii]